MPQLFFARHVQGNLIVVAAKIVDEILITVLSDQGKIFISAFNDRFKLGSAATGPGKIRFYGLKTIQDDEYSSMVDTDDKLSALETCQQLCRLTWHFSVAWMCVILFIFTATIPRQQC